MGSSKRYDWIVSVRAFAAMAIVLLHVVSGWTVEITRGGLSDLRWFLDILLIQPMVRWAVPVFVMMSGFLLLDPEKAFDTRKAASYIGRMAIVLATVGLFYCMIETYVSGEAASLRGIIAVSLKNLIEGKSWAHMWYVYMLIGLYAFTPLLRCFVRAADEKTMRFTLLVLFLLTIVRPTISAMLGVNITGFHCWEDPCLFYYLAGFFLPRMQMKRAGKAALMAFGAAGLTGSLIYGKYAGVSYEAMVGPSNAFIACYSMGIILLCENAKCAARAAEKPVIRQISGYSFGIYLFHVMFPNFFNKGLHLFPDILPAGIGEAAFFLADFLGAWLGTALLCKIKPVRRILVK